MKNYYYGYEDTQTQIVFKKRKHSYYDRTKKEIFPLSSLYIDEMVDYDILVETEDLSEDFIDENFDKFDLDLLVECQNLSLKFIDKYKNEFNWDLICQYQRLTEYFIEKHKDRINWSLISKYQNISSKFIRKYEDKIDWYEIIERVTNKSHYPLNLKKGDIPSEKFKEYVDEIFLIEKRLRGK